MTNLKLKSPVPFPASVVGAGGIGVSKSGGQWIIEPDFSSLSTVLPGALSDPSGKQIWIYDPITGSYSVLTLSGLGDALYTATSTTSIAIGTGSQTFTTQSGKDFGVGSFVLITSGADATNYMLGNITSYSTTSLVVNVTNIGGSGTHTDWTIRASSAPGSMGRSAGSSYLWSTDTTASDPTSGKIKANNATLSSATAIYISETDHDGNAVASAIATWDDSTSTIHGRLKIYNPVTPSNFALYDVTGTNTDSGTWDTINVSYVGSGGSFAASDTLAVLFIPKGDKGDQGNPGAGDMTSTNNLSDVSNKQTSFDNLCLHGSDIASASTINLDTATGSLVDVTGTTSITAVTLSNGKRRIVRFTGSLTLTNGANLVLPGGQNIQTAAGDFAEFVGYASSVVRCAVYQKGDGSALQTGLTTIASATTTDLGSTLSHSITISGTTTITSFGSTAPTGSIKHIEFSGALILTHNGTSLIIPGAASITTAAGDCIVARHEGSGNWRVMTYLRGAGRPLSTGVSDTLAVGYKFTPYSIGTVSSGTTTPDPANGNYQFMSNNGASTIAAPASDCAISLTIQNNVSPGSITFSNFRTGTATGDALSTSLRATATATFTNSSQNIGWTAHGCVVNDPVYFTNSGGALPTNFSASTIYYVQSVVDANTIKVSATVGGSAITAGSAGSGTQTGNAPSQFKIAIERVNGVSTYIIKALQ